VEKVKNRSTADELPRPDFKPNEFYEVLLRMRREQPRRYKSSISLGTQRCVEIYEELKRRANAELPK
jgi:hypothetical protein